MKIFKTFKFHTSKSLLMLIAIFLIMMAVGCSSKGSAIVDRVSDNLELQVDSKGISITLSSLDTRDFSETYFLHIYTDDYDKTPNKYTNKDFNLTKEEGKEIVTNGKKKIVFNKSFGDIAVKAFGIGQYTTPNGQCCNIIWSRTYLIGAGSR